MNESNLYQMTSTLPGEMTAREEDLHHVNLNLFFESVKAIYKNRIVNYEALLRKVEKQNKFVIKVDHLVKETEGTTRELSLADVWRWIKGLLDDFLKVREELGASQKMLARANNVISAYNEMNREHVCEMCKNKRQLLSPH